ncbi:hypothetical protein GCM10025794_31530 [Massilia kyonggiensis]
MAINIPPEKPMAGDVILQAIAEIVLNGPLDRPKVLRRLRWAILLIVLGLVVALTPWK